jgi:hypothetical protein
MNTSSQRRPRPERSAPEAKGEVAPTRRPDRTRLVVELNRATAADLDDLMELEDLNKTTLVNRALQMYAFLRKAERDGGQIFVQEAGESAAQRSHFL